MATFTDIQVKEIQDLYSLGETVIWLSWKYNTTPATIQNIIDGNYEYNKEREALPTWNLKTDPI